MGCICAKPSAANDNKESLEGKQFNNRSLDLRVASSRNEEKFGVKDKLRDGELSGGLIDKKGNNSRRVRDDHHEKKISDVVKHPSFGSIPKSMEGEQVAAGWPSWLAIAAGEALKGWLPRSANTFQKLDKIGQGTYSSVYKARDLTNKKVVALKRVRFDIMDPESIKFMAREIIILRRLDHPNIIKLEGLVTSRSSCSLYLVFEYMEHDLIGLASLPGVKFTEPQVKCYVHQLLRGLDHCHSRGVLHRDVKGSNLLIDNHGVLKIADFGLASFFYHHQSVPLTSRVVTLWYRPPELLLGATHYGVQVDLWSTGCILGELYAGKPIMPGRTEVEQLHKIFKLCGSPSEEYWAKSNLPHSTVFKPVQPYKRRLAETFKNFPAAAIGLMDTLLSIDPAQRGTAAFSLKSQFFRTEPLACDPSGLPKYPPSKEIDAKMREEASRRQGAVAVRGPRANCDVRGSKELQAVRAPVSNTELSSMQRKQNYLNPKSQSELYDLRRNESASGFPIDPPRQTQAVKETRKDFVEHPSKKVLHSGPLVSGVGREKVGDLYADISIISTGAELATLSGLVASRNVPSEECPDKLDSLPFEASNELGKLSESSQERTRKPDRKHRSQNNMGSHRAANGRSSTKEQVLYGHVLKGKKIHFSGPLVPSSNVDQMLRDHERQIQEAARRARIEKTRPGKFQAHRMQTMADPVCAASHR